jgi:hypothetical protein
MPVPGAHTEDVLTRWGFDPDEVRDLLRGGAAMQA